MIRRRLVGALLAGAALALPGCKSGTQDYVNEHSEGNYVVRGRLIGIQKLSTQHWTDLKDGFVLEVGKPGCRVTVQQEEGSQRPFDLKPGDRIVHGYDVDHIIAKLPAGGKRPKCPPPLGGRPDPR